MFDDWVIWEIYLGFQVGGWRGTIVVLNVTIELYYREYHLLILVKMYVVDVWTVRVSTGVWIGLSGLETSVYLSNNGNSCGVFLEYFHVLAETVAVIA